MDDWRLVPNPKLTRRPQAVGLRLSISKRLAKGLGGTFLSAHSPPRPDLSRNFRLPFLPELDDFSLKYGILDGGVWHRQLPRSIKWRTQNGGAGK